MSNQVPPQDSALPDEAALHQAFLAEYPSLAAEARSHLGNDAAALGPKVVEGAFVRAWDARSRFHTPAELRAFLKDDVHHAAARALSRRAAAHRFAHGDTGVAHKVVEPTTEQSWANIMHALHGEEHTPQQLEALAKASRHDAAEHIAGVAKSQPIWIGLAVAVVAFGAIGYGMRVMNVAAEKTRVAKAIANVNEVRLVPTPSGRTGVVDLTDGSKAHLAPQSKLTIPNEFGADLRGLKLEGGASFDVAQGLPKPFEVHAADVVIVATGTAFTVSAYADDSSVSVVVKEGSVDIKRGEEVLQSVGAGSGVVVRIGGPARAATDQEREEVDGWRSGTISLSDRSLKEAVVSMKRWYNFDIAVPDAALHSRRVTFRESLDSSHKAIAGIEKSAGVKFGYIGQNMVFTDAAAGK